MTRRSELKTRLILILRFLWRATGWGLVMGAVVGFCGIVLFGILITGGQLGNLSVSFGLMLSAIAVVMLYGAIFGVGVGGLSGVVLGIITALFFYQPRHLGKQKWAAGIVILTVTFLSFSVWFSQSIKGVSPNRVGESLYIVVLGAGGLVAAAYASWRIAKWYLQWHAVHYVRPNAAG